MIKQMIVLELVILCLVITGVQSQSAQDLGSMLNTDGTMNLESDFEGNLNPSGWRMVTDENGAPRFVPAEENTAFQSAQHIMTEDEAWWGSISKGANGAVIGMACSGGNVYMGGFFTEIGGISVNYIAKWNGRICSDLGTGVNSYVKDIACSGNDVYVGGEFTQAGGVSANYIAKWDGTSWSALGSGFNYYVRSIACSGNDVYVGGEFTQAGGVSANHIAKWDGTSWSALGSGVNGRVNAIACSGNYVYVGGEFTQAGGVSANHIAKWDGSSWSALGSGLNGWVYAIACSGSDVYVGGVFTQASGISANNIAKWDGTSWSALGSGTNNMVQTIDFLDNILYAGGWFTLAGGISTNRIARWDGTSWSALGSGASNDILDIEISGIDIYVGGYFTQAGGLSCPYVAVYHTIPKLSHLADVSAGDLTTDECRSIGCAWSDYDNAGDPDLFVANEGLQDNSNNMYINNGNGTFTGITSGDVVSDGSRSQGGTWGDYNNDGYPDLFVSNANGDDNILYENTNGVLYAVGIDPLTSEGGNSNGAAWADYDNDGYLDLFVANGGENNFLYHNNGNSTFTKVTTGAIVTDGGASTSAAWCDYDLDGDVDLFVPNTGWNVNFLYTNNGDGTFTKVTTGDVVSDAGESFGGSWGDYNNDGYPDLYVPQSGQDNLMYQNNGDGTFTKITDGLMVNDGIRSRSSGWGDLNLDGYLDLFVVNRNVNSHIYINKGDGTFSSYLIDPAVDGYGGAWSDYDLDGDLDLFVCQYDLVNHLWEYTGSGNHWLKVKCVGVASNKDAVGAKVKIRTGANRQYREINTQSGFGGQSDLVVEFGLGANVTVDEMVIEWSGGIVWDTTNVAADQMLMITEHVPSINQPPVAVDDQITVTEGSGVIIQVLDNDSDPDGDALVIDSIEDTGATGTVVINSGNTSVTYLAPAGFTGTDQFSYIVSDGHGGQDGAEVTVEVEPASVPNQPPVAVDDNVTIKQDSTVTIYPLYNDNDPEGDVLGIASILVDGIIGTAVINSGDTSLTYIPPAGWSGETVFDYVVSDGNGGLDTATVAIVVTPVSGISDGTVPSTYALFQNYPNPFNPITTISYELPEKSHVILRVYSVMGSEICTLVNEEKSVGQYEAAWNAQDQYGKQVSSGIYFYQLKAGDYSEIRKMLLVR